MKKKREQCTYCETFTTNYKKLKGDIICIDCDQEDEYMELVLFDERSDADPGL